MAQLAASTARARRAAAELKKAFADDHAALRFEWLAVAKLYNNARLSLIDRLPSRERAALMSFTELARDNLFIALEHLSTTLSLHARHRANDVVALPTTLSQPLVYGRLIWALIQLLLGIGAVVFVFRRGPALYQSAKRSFVSQFRNRARLSLVESTLALLEDAAPQAALLALALWVEHLLSTIGPEPELSVAFGVAIWILSYQLTAKLTHRLILRLLRRRHSLTDDLKERVLASVKTVMRFGFVAVYLARMTSSLVGEGVLFSVVRALLALVAIAVFLVIVRRWRADIVGTYLNGWPNTRLASIIARHQARWTSFPLALVALGTVGGRALFLLARDFVLGFEQTRKALSYFFQFRVERQAKERGKRAVDVDALPESVRAAFKDTPCVDDGTRLDRFDALAELVARMESGRPLNVLVSCPRGGGLSTWLCVLEERLEVPVLKMTPRERWRHKEDVYRAFSEALEVPPDEVKSALASGERRVVVVDEVERTFMRGLDGYRALNALLSVMRASEGTVSWVIGGHRVAIDFLEKVRRISANFDRRVDLEAFSEPEVIELIERRMSRVDLPLNFEGLLLRDSDDVVDVNQVVETRLGYLRLLWTQAMGNPRAVMHFWLRSLAFRDGELHVLLHDAPNADALEALHVEDRFVLQAVYLHRALSAEDISWILRRPRHQVLAHLARGTENGLYEQRGDEVCVTTHYASAVVRFLRRKNLM